MDILPIAPEIYVSSLKFCFARLSLERGLVATKTHESQRVSSEFTMSFFDTHQGYSVEEYE